MGGEGTGKGRDWVVEKASPVFPGQTDHSLNSHESFQIFRIVCMIKVKL